MFIILNNIFDIHMFILLKIFIKFKIVYLDINYLGFKYYKLSFFYNVILSFYCIILKNLITFFSFNILQISLKILNRIC